MKNNEKLKEIEDEINEIVNTDIKYLYITGEITEEEIKQRIKEVNKDLLFYSLNKKINFNDFEKIDFSKFKWVNKKNIINNIIAFEKIIKDFKKKAKIRDLSKNIIYNGGVVFGDFGLYELEGINFEASKKEILKEFKKKYELRIKKILSHNGLKLVGFNYYSPYYYNYNNDNIDLIIKIVNKNKLIKFIKDNQKQIQDKLDNNKSYDGFISLTKNDIQEVIKEVKDNKKVDVLVIAEMLEVIKEDIFKDDNINYLLLDNLVYE